MSALSFASLLPPERAVRSTQTRRRLLLLPVLLLVVAANTACLMTRIAVNKIGDGIASGGTVYASDNNPKLVREAVPFSLKLIESLLAESPHHRGLLLGACKGFTEHSYAFVQENADEIELVDFTSAERMCARARRFYLRARL